MDGGPAKLFTGDYLANKNFWGGCSSRCVAKKLCVWTDIYIYICMYIVILLSIIIIIYSIYSNYIWSDVV